MIPERIDIVGYDVGQTETQIGFELAARKRTRAGGIERTQKGKLFFIARLPVGSIARTLVEDAPDIDARVVAARPSRG